MNSRINLMALWKEFNPDAERSLREDFQVQEYAGMQLIAEYLDGGVVLAVAPECERDVFTDERIGNSLSVKTDGEYSWESTLSYYVRHYHLQLPTDFMEKALE